MPGKVKVKIIAGRNLPVMDRASDTTDAYVEIKLGTTTYKTDVCRKSLNPEWNSDWYRFEIDDSELQDEPLQIRLMDYDTYSANDAIGKVYLDLNPLLLPAAGLLSKYRWNNEPNSNQKSSAVMSGWIPVYDTMHGIRGEVNVTVKVELFSDFNKFRQSSCGVPFFYSPVIPHGYHAKIIHGFVEELIVNDDPEYQWIDKIRTPRASNEARQTLFFKLSGELQRKIGVKALDLGGNAVIGYSQCFDLEGESGIVARGIGTAVTLIKLQESSSMIPITLDSATEESYSSSIPERRGGAAPNKDSADVVGHHRTESVGGKASYSPARLHMTPCIHRRSSDSDLSITPKGNSLTENAGRANTVLRSTMHQENFDIMEHPFLTMSRYPPGFITHLGSLVCSRSVKLLERITNIEEPETRDIWWSELRMEIRSHAKALNCNAVLGYSESASICEDVCVLSATGVAAVIGNRDLVDNAVNIPIVPKNPKDLMATSLDKKELQIEKDKLIAASPAHTTVHPTKIEENPETTPAPACAICHIPYNDTNVPFPISAKKCGICKKAKVPDVLLSTTDVPEGIPIVGMGCFIQSFVCRSKRDLKGELNAKEISDAMPFLEYELHRLLVNKLKVKGMNAVFGLKVRISIGERLIIGLATGTAVYLKPLPPPPVPILVSDGTTDDKKLADMQSVLHETVKINRETYNLIETDFQNNKIHSDSEESENEPSLPMGDLDCKDSCVLEIDDAEDIECLNHLLEVRPPEGFHVVNTEMVPGLDDLDIIKNLQMFTQIFRAKIPLNHPTTNFAKHLQRLLQSVYFKLRSMIPCALCNLKFRVDLPEQDEIQLFVLGMALGLGSKKEQKNDAQTKPDDELIFNLEEDNSATPNANSLHIQPPKSRQKSPQRFNKTKPNNPPTTTSPSQPPQKTRERLGVDITPLSYIPGARIERYLGNLNFFFIRETTSIREGGGFSGFTHSFVTEVFAIVRAHITALGGNAMVAYFMTECVLYQNPHKNQGQCLINVGGDVVQVTYLSD